MVKRSGDPDDYKKVIRSMVIGGFLPRDQIGETMLNDLLRCCKVIEVLKGKEEPDDVDKLYLRALDELAEEGELAAKAMCDILLRNNGSPEKILAASVLDRMGSRAVPVICERLRANTDRGRVWLVPVLLSIGDPSAIQTLEDIACEGGEVGAVAQEVLESLLGHIHFSCPNCDAHLVTNKTHAGMKVKCTHCSAMIEVPKTSTPVTKAIVVEDVAAPIDDLNLPALFKKFQVECVMQVVAMTQTQGRTLSEEDQFNSVMACVHKKLNQATGRDIPVDEFTKLMNQGD